MSLPESVNRIYDHLRELGVPDKVDASIILGSGLGGFRDHIRDPLIIPYADIPELPVSTVIGHEGSLIFGTVDQKKVLAFAGRFHFYEGYGIDKVIIPVQLAAAFGTSKLIISNAAGGINLDYRVGDLMVIEHILRLNRICGMPSSAPWHYDLYPWALRTREIAADLGIDTHIGNYLYVSGPNYETKAEIQAFRKLGGDAVGMSTAPELMEASRLGLKAAAISLITNAAAGVTNQKLDHDEVKEAATQSGNRFSSLVKALIASL